MVAAHVWINELTKKKKKRKRVADEAISRIYIVFNDQFKCHLQIIDFDKQEIVNKSGRI